MVTTYLILSFIVSFYLKVDVNLSLNENSNWISVM